MNIQINGEAHDIQCVTLSELLEHLQHEPGSVATALNQDFVPIHERASCHLSEGDAIDIIAPMSGG